MATAAPLTVLFHRVTTTTAASTAYAAPVRVPESLSDALLYASGLTAGHLLDRLPDSVVKGRLDGNRYVSEGEPPEYDHQRPLGDDSLYNIGDLIGFSDPIISPGCLRNGGIEDAKEVSGKD
ncbi:MAG: hypothetical protein J3R72DRAFT_501339 [Linnemannia gamsii]|nr:MAG: hypothetical protein J3R72DRAFT_501339 [Linnemannia gamsii]